MCNNKISSNCGDKDFAACTYYETTLPDWSTLKEESCVNLEETTAETYEVLTEIKEEIDLSDLTSECIEIEVDADDKITVRTFAQTVLTKLEEILCSEEDANDIDITGFGLDYKCLVDACEDPQFPKLSNLLQALINKECEEDTPQILINAGAVSLDTELTYIQTTTASAQTLDVGRENQVKTIVMTEDGGNATLAVPSMIGGTQIVFDAVNDFIQLKCVNTKWFVISNVNCTIS